jgi:SAM-dependent methyltransferase
MAMARDLTRTRLFVFHAMVAAFVLTWVALASGRWDWALAAAALTAGAWALGRVWSRKYPVPMPYQLRWVLLLPRGPHSAQRLLAILEPRSGERMLEVGPGVGVHALPVASSLAPGILEVLDVRQEMLDALMRRAAGSGLRNIAPRRADAQALPYEDHVLDAAFLISVLGEIPDPPAALRELRRVLKRDGRLVIGEVFVDPDFVSLPGLERMASAAGFDLVRTSGPRLCYLALLRPTGG